MTKTNGDYCRTVLVGQDMYGLAWKIGEQRFAIYLHPEDKSVHWSFRGQVEWAEAGFPDEYSDALSPILEEMFVRDIEAIDAKD